MALRCVSSQWIITVSPDSFVHQYDVDIVFGRPETVNDENGRGVKKLSKSNNAISKSICRQIVQGLPELNGIIYVYNDRAILLTNKPLKDDIKVTISQSNLDESLRKILISRESVLKIAITKTKTIKLSDFPIDAASTLKEDRTWRTLIEMIISEDAVTRVNDKYIPIDGAICENKFTNFCCGLIYRNGVKKGVEVIELDNRPQLALTMDYCCKFLYPGGIIFLDLIKRFMSENGTYKDAEAFFKNIKLCPTYDRSRILIFYKFTEKSMRFLKTQNGGTLEEYYRSWNIRLRYLDEPAAITNGYGDFPLELLEVLANQSVSIGKMPGGSIQENALGLSRLAPNERFDIIQRQFNKLSFNNSITSAFGLKINTRMLEGEYQRLPPMKMILHRNTVECNDQSSFKYGQNMYYKAAGFSKIVVFATRRDYQKSMECANAIVQEALNKGMQMPTPIFKEFDTYSKQLKEWIQALNESKGIKTIVLVIDNNKESHPIVKLAEALTGVQTQHLVFDTAFKVARGGHGQTLENIVHKLNIKAGGMNHLVDFGRNLKKINLAETLIISMDVCHPGINSEAEEPSSVGVVSNYLSDSNEFAGLFFYQSPGQEAINPSFLELYVKKMFHQAQKHRSIKNVIVLRDGISEGQYQMFVEKEMNAIIEATSEIKANYIAMIVTKDGITRHFMDISDRIQSMPSRSFISFGCRFGFNQMYMVAHNSTLGTARTAMITVLRDDMNLSKIELQTFLLGLTHMHQIVNAPISLPAPLQQADSLAEHGQKGFRALKKEHERDIPKRDDGTIEYMQLSNLLNCSNGELPSTRYTA